MNNYTLAGLIIGAFVIIGGIGYLVYGSSSGEPAPTATTTPPVVTPSVVRTPVAPFGTTGTLVVASNATAVVTGTVIPNGAFTSYWYDYGRTESLGALTTEQSVGSGYASIATPGIITGLAANTTYFYRLSAQNGYGTVRGVTYSFMTNQNPPITGLGPTIRTDAATAVTRTTAVASGQVNPNSHETTYWFEYGETAELGETTVLQSAGNGSGAKSVSVMLSGLKPMTAHYFRVNAQNQFGTMTGGTNRFTTSGPIGTTPPPAILSVTTAAATTVTDTGVLLNGSLNPNGGTVTYWFQYGADPLGGSILGSTTHTTLSGSGVKKVSAKLTTLTQRTKYYYQLIVNNGSTTVRGAIVSFTTMASAVTP
ncbi:MAG: hypothetical protein AAB442_02075 [Patescibacteria group bacterium]